MLNKLGTGIEIPMERELQENTRYKSTINC
jgi:hypothetical protein